LAERAESPTPSHRRGGSLAEGAGSSPPDIDSKAGAAYANPRLCSASDTAVTGSFVSPDPPNMGHLTNGWSAPTVLYSLLRDLRAVGELLRLAMKNGDALCLKEVGFERKSFVQAFASASAILTREVPLGIPRREGG
jgi:hypothetical protein